MGINFTELRFRRTQALSIIGDAKRVNNVPEDVFLPMEKGWLDIYRFRTANPARRDMSMTEIKEFISQSGDTTFFRPYTIEYSKDASGKIITPQPKLSNDIEKLVATRKRVRKFLYEKNFVTASSLLNIIVPATPYTEDAIERMQKEKEHYFQQMRLGDRGVIKKFYRRCNSAPLKYLDVYAAAIALALDSTVDLGQFIISSSELDEIIPKRVKKIDPSVNGEVKPKSKDTLLKQKLPEYNTRVLVKGKIRRQLSELNIKNEELLKRLVPLYEGDPVADLAELKSLQDEHVLELIKTSYKYIKTSVFLFGQRGHISIYELHLLCQDFEKALKTSIKREMVHPIGYFTGQVDDFEEDVDNDFIDAYNDFDPVPEPDNDKEEEVDDAFAEINKRGSKLTVLEKEIKSPIENFCLNKIDMSKKGTFPKNLISYHGPLTEQDRAVIEDALKAYKPNPVTFSVEKVHQNYSIKYYGHLTPEHKNAIEELLKGYGGIFTIT